MITDLVFNEQDSSITVAFDDIPEEGLNSPLRLEKLANEVCFLKFIICCELYEMKNHFCLNFWISSISWCNVRVELASYLL